MAKALLFADSFDHYLAAESIYKWDIGSIPVASVGRRGTQGAQWNSDRAARNLNAAHTRIIAGGAFFLTSSGFSVERVADLHSLSANTATSNCWLLGLATAGVPQCGLVASNDGTLHALRGGAFVFSAGAGGVEVIGSSAPGAVSFTGWCYIEVRIYVHNSAGTFEAWVNGNKVLDLSGVRTTHPTVNYSHASQFVIGGGTFGAPGGAGWSGRLDDVYVMSWTVEGDLPLGDIRVEYCKPDGAGVASDSVIVGDAPLPTRWQSVADQTPDGEDTMVEFAADGDADSYTHEDLPYDEADVFAVQHVMCASKADAGIGRLRATQRVNATDDEGSILHHPAGGPFSYFLTPFDKAADDVAWDLERFNESQFGVTREAA